MKSFAGYVTVLLIMVAGLLLPSGCAVGADILNPDLFSQFGLDLESVTGDSGVVIVAFNNTTNASVTFYAFAAPNRQDVSGARNFSLQVDPLSVGNEVLDCPVAVIAPGTLQADFSTDGVAALIQTEDAETTVNYAGQPLLSGTAFTCGDVVEVRLVSTTAGTGDNVEYSILVRRIPG